MGRLRFRSIRYLVVAGLVGVASMLAPAVSAAVYDPVPIVGWGVNGNVHAVVIVGDMVVVGGTFSQATSPTGVSVPRQNLAAFSLSTGALLTDWRADTDKAVKALDTDGTSLWVGGDFTQVGGFARTRLAKLDAVTAEVDPAFAPKVNSGVKTIQIDGPDLYIGGGFGAVNKKKHAHVAKLRADTGTPDETFHASADLTVYTLVKSPTTSTLYIGGNFDAVDGTARLGVAAVDSTTGDLVGPTFQDTGIPVYGLDISPDGTVVYGAQTNLNQGSAWDVDTGAELWQVGTDGNVQCVRYFDGVVYLGFHDGYQLDTTVKLLAVDPATGDVDPSFKPSIDSFYGVFALDVTADGLAIGGAFKTVSGVKDKHVAIFHAPVVGP
jgi:hypothetical protein